MPARRPPVLRLLVLVIALMLGRKTEQRTLTLSLSRFAGGGTLW
jgi:hypothetical protein